jgi:hypothetical protein
MVESVGLYRLWQFRISEIQFLIANPVEVHTLLPQFCFIHQKTPRYSRFSLQTVYLKDNHVAIICQLLSTI